MDIEAGVREYLEETNCYIKRLRTRMDNDDALNEQQYDTLFTKWEESVDIRIKLNKILGEEDKDD